MRASAFIFGTDLIDEGADVVLDNLQRRGGLDGVAFSATYHDARDIFAHNPRRHVFRNEGDVTWFTVAPAHYASGLVPRQAAADGADLLADVCRQAHGRGMAVTAWTIFTHNSLLATAHPDCATRNVYGDPYLTDLCPANPRVRAYCCELAADVVRRPVQRLLAESLHYRPLEHGEHHERYLIPLPLDARMLMSLCFCTHCRAAAARAGVDVEGLASAARAALQPVWEGVVQPGQALLNDALRSEVAAYVEVRCATVSSLVAEVREAMAPSGVPLTFVDHAGTMAHVMHGVTVDDDVLAASRRLGIDPVAVAAVVDEVCILGYQDTPQRLATVLGRYRAALGKEVRLALALRPLLPDCLDADNLAQKLRHAADAGVQAVDFYHYAMMPLNRLDWIRQGLAAAAGAPR